MYLKNHLLKPRMIRKILKSNKLLIDAGKKQHPFENQKSLLHNLSICEPVIFDIGAHIGNVSAKYRSQFPKSRIYCFEAFPQSIDRLKTRFREDKLVHIVPFAVDSVPGTKKFYVSQATGTNSLLPRPDNKRRYYSRTSGSDGSMSVEAIRIDDFVQENQIQKVDILKLDIQGGELRALNGATNILISMGIPIIYIEVFFVSHYAESPSFFDIYEFLCEFQYSLFDLYNMVHAENGQLRYCDALFVHERVRTEVLDKYPDEP